VKVAVVLLNLGGPDNLAAVRPFLFNLFRDRAIIDLPAVARYPLAWLISTTREKTAQANYRIMGGRSPLLPETEAQARALEAEIRARTAWDARVFIAMRYWKPFAAETARQVADFAPDHVVLLPLYPQYSTTTTASSVKDFKRAYRGSGAVHTVCCYPTADNVVEAHLQAIRETWEAAGRPPGVRLLFSAHGLPQRVVDAGDPYQAQIEATARAIAARLPEFTDWQVCYQSRVGRLKWLEPSTEDAIHMAAGDGVGVMVIPIAFVSEHVETLVELDHEYADLAKSLGIATYLRSPTPGVRSAFITGLADAASGAVDRAVDPHPYRHWRCPQTCGKCPWRAHEGEGVTR
jgi:ferrochelatase